MLSRGTLGASVSLLRMWGSRAKLIGALRRLFAHPALLPFTALVLRARTVRESTRFTLRELLCSNGARTYRLSSSGLSVLIRHGTADVVTLGEIFHDGDYIPPTEVESVLDAAREIVDLGANIGLFGIFAADCWPTARITAFEPDPGNYAMHERMIRANRLNHRWQLVPAAAGSHDGEARFLAGQATLSRIARDDEETAVTVPVKDVLELVSRADFMKMDIEGGEWAILEDPRFRRSPPRTLVLEYHPQGCPTADPRAAAEDALRAARMTIRSRKHREEGYGILWAWRD